MEQDEEKRVVLQNNLDLAIRSVASYVERSDTLMILAPPTVHEDRIHTDTRRKAFTCYRTWRRRGLCLLELFACFFSRRKTHAVLLVRSERDTPMYISPHESLKLRVGDGEFTCCETNHRGHDGKSFMKCSRHIARDVLKTLIQVKTQDLCEQNEVVHARWLEVLQHVWIRGLVESPKNENEESLSLARFKTILHWNSQLDGDWIDREGVSLLTYAACTNNMSLLCAVLKEIKDNLELIDARLPKSGFVYVGIPGSCTALIGAMVLGSCEMVEILLNHGANPYITDVNKFDPLMCACVYRRAENVRYWLTRFPEYRINKKRGKFGSKRKSCTCVTFFL